MAQFNSRKDFFEKKKQLIQPKPQKIKKVLDTLYNIILLGESGVGKSTLINSIANYLKYQHKTLQDAIDGQPVELIGTSHLYSDKDGNIKTITACEDENELIDLGQSATQRCKSYKFDLYNGIFIRLIDTPGISDTRGSDQDLINFEYTMKMINACGKIAAFCIVMKSNHTRMNESFVNCLNQLFSQLHPNIKKNIVFIFTHGRGANYSPLTTFQLVNKFLIECKIGIKLSKENAHCFENDTFNHLMLTKRNLKSEINNCNDSWKMSSQTCAEFISYVLKLNPQDVRDTISINKTRQLLDQLILPLVKITEQIEENLKSIAERKKEIKSAKDMQEIKKINDKSDNVFETFLLRKPKLVCTSNKCTTYVGVDGIFTKAIFGTTCCPDCGPIKHLLGHGSNVRFRSRAMFGHYYCSKCDCSERDHRILYLETRLAVNINNFKPLDKIQLLAELETRYSSYLNERQYVIKALAKFSYYLKENSMIKFSDFFKNSIKEKFKLMANKSMSIEISNMLEIYKKEKKLIKSSPKLTFEDLEKTKQELCALQYNGNTLKKVYEILDNKFGGLEIVDESCLRFPFHFDS